MDCGDSSVILAFVCIAMICACMLAVIIESVNGSE